MSVLPWCRVVVKDGPLQGRRRLVLDGREHDGRLGGAGGNRFALMAALVLDRREIAER
jgi:hypothetical protein